MIQHPPKVELFKRQLQNSLNRETKNSRIIKFSKNANIYSCGDKSDNVYFIESGQVKLLTLSPSGKECLLAIYTSGDIFGEICLSEIQEHPETVVTMEETYVKVIPCSNFFQHLIKDSLFEGFVRYLATRISEQQQVITNLVTVDSEKRLGKILLQLAQKLGKKHPRSVIIKHKLTQEDLSKMVGTTRPRISEFLKTFRRRNLIEINRDHFIVVKEKNLSNYLNEMS